MDKTKIKDFVEISFTGYNSGNIFDSNIEEDLKKISSSAKPKKTIVAIGEKMVVVGLDKALIDKEIGKEYRVDLPAKQAFGERDRNLLKTIPLKTFTEQKINPFPGAMLNMDGTIVKIISISGARVLTDFNNPLSGKDISYKYKIDRIVTDDNEKVKALFENTFKFIPEFEISGENLIVKGIKPLEQFLMAFKGKIKELLDKNLLFEEKKIEKKEDKILTVKK